MKIKLYKVLSCALLSVASSMILQAMRKNTEQILQRAEQNMAKLFPQTEATEFATQAMTSPAARNKLFYYLIKNYIVNNDSKEALDVLKLGLKQGFNVNYQDALGGTLLYNAILHENIDLIKALLNAGANPNT